MTGVEGQKRLAELKELIHRADDAATVERVAEAAHVAFCGWMEWMLLKIDETHASGETFRERWARQARTPYSELLEAEKESDRIEARRYIKAFMGDLG